MHRFRVLRFWVLSAGSELKQVRVRGSRAREPERRTKNRHPEPRTPNLEPPKSVFHQHGDRVKPVAPADLLPARAVSWIECHRALHDAAPLAQELRRYLRLNIEAIRFELETASDRRRHDL